MGAHGGARRALRPHGKQMRLSLGRDSVTAAWGRLPTAVPVGRPRHRRCPGSWGGIGDRADGVAVLVPVQTTWTCWASASSGGRIDLCSFLRASPGPDRMSEVRHHGDRYVCVPTPCSYPFPFRE